MPVYLKALSHDPKGVDGKGWNRMGLNGLSLCGDECALKPKSLMALFEMQDTRRASYGLYGTCSNNGECTTCDTLKRESYKWRWFGTEILVRVHPNSGEPWSMHRPDKGWGEYGEIESWDDLASMENITLTMYRDEHGVGVMLKLIDAS